MRWIIKRFYGASWKYSVESIGKERIVRPQRHPHGYEPDTMTMTRFILEEQRKRREAHGHLSQLLYCVQTAVKACASAIRQAGFASLRGIAGWTNPQGEETKKLDGLTNQIFKNVLGFSHTICMMVSEEEEQAIIVDKEPGSKCKYIICFDPIDGSNNIDCLVSIGSIFSILKNPNQEEPVKEKDALQPGKNIIAAGYALYGSATAFVLALKSGVTEFTYDPAIGEFILSDNEMNCPEDGRIYSINEAQRYYHEGVSEYLNDKKNQEKPYTARYTGTMVADAHRTMKYGGICLFPRLKDQPEGRLRLLYEGAPLAFIMEKIGGLATTGEENILDIVPTDIHQRTPVIMGSKNCVNDFLQYLK